MGNGPLPGPQGLSGATGPTGPAGAVPEDIFASFIGSSELFTDGNQLLLFRPLKTSLAILPSRMQHIQLSAGLLLLVS